MTLEWYLSFLFLNGFFFVPLKQRKAFAHWFSDRLIGDNEVGPRGESALEDVLEMRIEFLATHRVCRCGGRCGRSLGSKRNVREPSRESTFQPLKTNAEVPFHMF